MTVTIALAGKGGVGKTTISGMVIKYLASLNSGNILAIDADPSSNLNMVLGLDLEWTVGDIREDMLSQVKSSLAAGGASMGTIQGGQSKREYLDYHIRSSLAEGIKYDLIAMGRSEGSGCYCAVNHNLREVIDSISKNYQFVVIDNEAGMEHLSRRTTRDVQHLLIISDPSQRGLVAAKRIAELKEDLEINIENAYLIVNRVKGDLPEEIKEFISKMEVTFLGSIPEDGNVSSFDVSGRPLIELEQGTPVYQTVSNMIERVLN